MPVEIFRKKYNWPEKGTVSECGPSGSGRRSGGLSLDEGKK